MLFVTAGLPPQVKVHLHGNLILTDIHNVWSGVVKDAAGCPERITVTFNSPVSGEIDVTKPIVKSGACVKNLDATDKTIYQGVFDVHTIHGIPAGFSGSATPEPDCITDWAEVMFTLQTDGHGNHVFDMLGTASKPQIPRCFNVPENNPVVPLSDGAADNQ